ncbi:type II toxin-antitoxin system RelE/ParE family toxin [Parabacteroides sp. PF5-6]|uniref:type II toxin-antitoxin system RelE/ParE family toxin n=1 Tax=Parabacteroides sp. PF5-6 TaxID=1742403 RepID=UPI0024050EF9|nr:type II toxin-antitoxin system RelE/ParE family toxin [Parabacteroides sp. PF5-6]MDF9828951.1 proteic killer suppression protein [Parabacteroides sp. PF5-6]
MIVAFEKKYLRDLYEEGKTDDKKHRYQPEIIRKYKRCIDILLDANNIEALFRLNSLNYEVLKGNKQGISSIRVDKQYRIEFTVTNDGAEPVVTLCNILELSNHYK